ncbi:hypothetical protein UE95_024945, partial [Burkholderia cenocepacia]|nr:hypothetical protein [Burkholderia cenocepacia]MCW3714540.1 hypothetical protein [Burkholderia cenocepacia]
MTVESAIQDVSYDTDGSTVLFPLPFYFLQESDIVVDKIDANGGISTLVRGTDYTVGGAGNEAGGYFTTLATYTSGFKLHAYRVVAATQETEFQQNDPFPAKSVERALDKLTMLVQQTDGTVKNALRYPPYEYGRDGTLRGANDR